MAAVDGVNIYDHYWKLTSDPTHPGTTHVFSSARKDYFVLADATYVAWLAAGNIPATAANEAALMAVLAPWGIPVRPGDTAIVPASAQVNDLNLVINGGMDFFQRQVPGSATARSDDTYGPDRFYLLTQTASVNCERVVSGLSTSVYSAKLTQNQALAQRMGLAQIIPYTNSLPMRNRVVRSQWRISVTNSQPIRCAILESTGILDVPVSDVVNDWTSGTYTSGNFFLGTSLTVTAVASITPAANTPTDLFVTGILSDSAKNIILMVWTEGTAAQNFVLYLAEVGLYDTAIARPWMPRHLSIERSMCEYRFCKGAYEIDAAPGTSSVTSIITAVPSNTIVNQQFYNYVPFPVRMAGIPAVNMYGYSGGASKVSNGSGTDLAANSGTPSNISSFGFVPYNNSGGTVTTTLSVVLYHFTAEKEL